MCCPGQTGRPVNRKTSWFTPDGCQCTYAYGRGSAFRPGLSPRGCKISCVVMAQCGLACEAKCLTCCTSNSYVTLNDGVGLHSVSDLLFAMDSHPTTLMLISLGGPREFVVRDNRTGKRVGSLWLVAGDLLAIKHWSQCGLKHGSQTASSGLQQQP